MYRNYRPEQGSEWESGSSGWVRSCQHITLSLTFRYGWTRPHHVAYPSMHSASHVTTCSLELEARVGCTERGGERIDEILSRLRLVIMHHFILIMINTQSCRYDEHMESYTSGIISRLDSRLERMRQTCVYIILCCIRPISVAGPILKA